VIVIDINVEVKALAQAAVLAVTAIVCRGYVAPAARSQTFVGTVNAFHTGNQLMIYCSRSPSDDQSACFGYLSGVADTLAGHDRVLGLPPACIPAGVTHEQLRDIVMAYLQQHANIRHQGASYLTTLALTTAFPCA
jgi:hypothetical protein